MKFYVKEWDDHTVTIMTEMGQVLGYFASVYDALNTCEQWYQHHRKELQHEVMVHAPSSSELTPEPGNKSRQAA